MLKFSRNFEARMYELGDKTVVSFSSDIKNYAGKITNTQATMEREGIPRRGVGLES